MESKKEIKISYKYEPDKERERTALDFLVNAFSNISVKSVKDFEEKNKPKEE